MDFFDKVKLKCFVANIMKKDDVLEETIRRNFGDAHVIELPTKYPRSAMEVLADPPKLFKKSVETKKNS